MCKCDFEPQDEEPVNVAKDLRMPQFELEAVRAKACDNKIHMGEGAGWSDGGGVVVVA